jgi:hypothetical protein
MKKLLLITAVCCVFATPSFSEGIPIEYQGIWCYVGKESTGEMQLYHKAQKMCREDRERVMTVKRFGLIVSNKGSNKSVLCVAPRDFAQGTANIGIDFKMDCGSDDNSSPVKTYNFFMYPSKKDHIGVVIK